jgi:ATP-dependent Clp protease ATP-binding subunit ClpA
LAEGKIRLIGATTNIEASQYIFNKGEAVQRRFQLLALKELTEEQTIDILSRKKNFYEKYYSKQFGINFTIHPDSIKTVVKKVKIHLPNQVLPASAINLLEEVCAIQGWKENEFEKSQIIQLTEKNVVEFCEEKYPTVKEASSKRSWTQLFNHVISGLVHKMNRLFLLILPIRKAA